MTKKTAASKKAKTALAKRKNTAPQKVALALIDNAELAPEKRLARVYLLCNYNGNLLGIFSSRALADRYIAAAREAERSAQQFGLPCRYMAYRVEERAVDEYADLAKPPGGSGIEPTEPAANLRRTERP